MSKLMTFAFFSIVIACGAQNSDVRSEVLSFLKLFRRDNNKSYLCAKQKLGITDDEIDEGRDLQGHPRRLILASKHRHLLFFLATNGNDLCEKIDSDSVIKQLAATDYDDYQVMCYKLKLTTVDPQSPFLVNFNATAHETLAVNCNHAIVDPCLTVQDTEDFFGGHFTKYNITSCKISDFYPNDDRCRYLLESLIAKSDNSLPADLRVKAIVDGDNKDIAWRTDLYECIGKDVLRRD
jgi:hypothetical protein